MSALQTVSDYLTGALAATSTLTLTLSGGQVIGGQVIGGHEGSLDHLPLADDHPPQNFETPPTFSF